MIITILSTIIIYTHQGIPKYQKNPLHTIKFLATTIILLISNFLITTSNIITKSIHKKNLLRINLLIITTILIFSINQRIQEYSSKIITSILLFQTILYTTLFILNIKLLKRLRILTQKLYTKSIQTPKKSQKFL